MINGQRVNWNNGMLLTAEHLDIQQHYMTQLLINQFKLSTHHYWGIYEMSIDQASLTHGRLTINKINGILPNGYPFSTHSQKPISLSLDNISLPASIFIYHDPDDLNLDENNIGYSSLKLIATNTPTQEQMKIAIIDADSHSTGILFNYSFIPPILTLISSSQLMEKIQLLRDTLSKHSNHRQLINELTFLIDNPTQHPYQLYRCIYLIALNYNINIEAYEHNNLQLLVNHINTLTQKISAENTSIIQQRFNRDGFYWHAKIEHRLRRTDTLIIGIPLLCNHQIIPENQIKLGSRSQIDSIVRHALEGLKLIPYHDRHHFSTHTHQIYSVDTSSEYWSLILNEQQLSIYLPSSNIISEPKLWIKQ